MDEYNLTKIFQINENDQIIVSKNDEENFKKLKQFVKKVKNVVITILVMD